MGKKKKGKAKGKGKGKGSGTGKKKAEPAVTAEGKARDGPAAIADLCVALKLPRKVVSDVCASNASTISMLFGELLEDGAPQRGAAEEEQGSAVAPPPSGPSEVGLGRYMKKGTKAELYADDFSDDDDDVFSMGEGKGMTSCDVGSDQLICRFNTRTPASLVQGLRMSGRGVTMVDLSNNTLEGDVAGVCAALSDHCPRLTFLDLSDNGLDDASGAAVAELMVTRGNVVRRLALRNNQLTEVFAKQLADALLSRSGVQLLHVDLRRNRVGPGGGVAMGRLLGTLPDMTHVDLGWNDLRCDGAAALLAGFSQLCATGWSTPHLQHLDLSWNGLDDGVGEAFGDLLENSKSLTTLVIDHNRFGEATGLAVARGLVANEHLLYLKIGFNPLGRRATREIIEALRSNTAVAVLGVENTMAHRDLGSTNADPGKEDGKMGDEGGDDTDAHMQGMWELAQDVKAGRSKLTRIDLEFPPQQRSLPNEGKGADDENVEGKHSNAMRKESVFLQRASYADSGTFWDTEQTVRRAFETDWSHARFSKVIRRATEVEAVREVLQPSYLLVKELFRYYAACGSQSPHVLNVNQFHDFCRDYDLIHPTYLTAAQADMAYYETNAYKNDSNEGGGSSPNGENMSVDSRALERFQFLEVLQRMALKRFIDGARRTSSASEAMEILLQEHLKPFAFQHCDGDPDLFRDANIFRDQRLYFEEVEQAFRSCVVELRALFFYFCGESSKRMTIDEWLHFVTESGLEDSDFTRVDARLVFVYSKMLVVDEVKVAGGAARGKDSHEGMHFVDFVEALGRTADLKSVGSYARDVPLSWKLRLLLQRIMQSQSALIQEALERKITSSLLSNQGGAVGKRRGSTYGIVIPPEQGRHEEIAEGL